MKQSRGYSEFTTLSLGAIRSRSPGKSMANEGLKQKATDVQVGEAIKKRVDEERTTKQGIEKQNTKPRQP